MSEPGIIDDAAVDHWHAELERRAEGRGYHLNPDREFARALVRGLLVNQARYGYQACPCRLADGVREADLDLICPCDYRDPDLATYGTCYCGLYVAKSLLAGGREPGPIPDRRPAHGRREKMAVKPETGELSLPVWRCKVCGYLCAREEPPEVCPICHAEKDRFARFM